MEALPEGCIANVVSLTSPPDACRVCAVCSLFRSAAESDAVWERLLPPDYQYFISRSDYHHHHHASSSSSKKHLYLTLCHNPILIHHGRMSFSLDKATGKKCFMLSARALTIVWSDTPKYWSWITDPDSRFAEVAELIDVCWLEIRGKIDTCMLSPSTLYAAYLVFKLGSRAYGLDYPPAEVSVGLIGGDETREQRSVYLNNEREASPRSQFVRRRFGIFDITRGLFLGSETSPQTQDDDAAAADRKCYPKKRGDGWLEIELGEFFRMKSEAGELEMSVLDVKGGGWKGGLVVQGIEIRPKSGACIS